MRYSVVSLNKLNCKFSQNKNLLIKNTAVLVNYWKMSENVYDSVGYANLYAKGYNYFTSDRCNVKSAIYLNNGYLEVPSDYYFNNDFSVTAWINIKTSSLISIIDFGNGYSSNNILFYVNGNRLYGKTYQGSTATQISSVNQLELNIWYHVAFSVNGTRAFLYSNGVQIANCSNFIKPLNTYRSYNVIGLQYGSSSSVQAPFDEIKIFRGALTETEIRNHFYKICPNVSIQ